jgi:uncharacterized membrane protein
MSERAIAPRWAPAVTLPLALLGLAVSTYLTYIHYAAPRALSCPETAVINCTKVTTSPESMLLGFFPVALAGALYFLVVTALVTPAAWRSGRAVVGQLRIAAAVAGIGMVCYLIYVEAVQVHALCLYCTGVHLVTFLLFVAILGAWMSSPVDER